MAGSLCCDEDPVHDVQLASIANRESKTLELSTLPRHLTLVAAVHPRRRVAKVQWFLQTGKVVADGNTVPVYESVAAWAVNRSAAAVVANASNAASAPAVVPAAKRASAAVAAASKAAAAAAEAFSIAGPAPTGSFAVLRPFEHRQTQFQRRAGGVGQRWTVVTAVAVAEDGSRAAPLVFRYRLQNHGAFVADFVGHADDDEVASSKASSAADSAAAVQPGCEASPWSEWSDCSAPCGGGLRRRVRGTRGTCALTLAEQSEACNAEPCHQSSATLVLSPQCACSACPCAAAAPQPPKAFASDAHLVEPQYDVAPVIAADNSPLLPQPLRSTPVLPLSPAQPPPPLVPPPCCDCTCAPRLTPMSCRARCHSVYELNQEHTERALQRLRHRLSSLFERMDRA